MNLPINSHGNSTLSYDTLCTRSTKIVQMANKISTELNPIRYPFTPLKKRRHRMNDTQKRMKFENDIALQKIASEKIGRRYKTKTEASVPNISAASLEDGDQSPRYSSDFLVKKRPQPFFGYASLQPETEESSYKDQFSRKHESLWQAMSRNKIQSSSSITTESKGKNMVIRRKHREGDRYVHQKRQEINERMERIVNKWRSNRGAVVKPLPLSKGKQGFSRSKLERIGVAIPDHEKHSKSTLEPKSVSPQHPSLKSFFLTNEM